MVEFQPRKSEKTQNLPADLPDSVETVFSFGFQLFCLGLGSKFNCLSVMINLSLHHCRLYLITYWIFLPSKHKNYTWSPKEVKQHSGLMKVFYQMELRNISHFLKNKARTFIQMPKFFLKLEYFSYFLHTRVSNLNNPPNLGSMLLEQRSKN